LGIPVVAVVDTNNSPDGVDYVIPGNDDAIRAVRLYTTAIADAVVDGKGSRTDGPVKDDFVEVKDAAPEVEPTIVPPAQPEPATHSEASIEAKVNEKTEAKPAGDATDENQEATKES